MEFTTLGHSGVRVSKIGLGTWAIGGWMWGGNDDSLSVRTVHQAIEQGITLIDTAPVYGFGHSEELVGTAIAQTKKRDQLQIATKVGLQWDSANKVTRNSSPARLEQEINDSLRRLRTDYIDLYQVHWPDEKTDFEKTAGVLERFKRAGKIRAIGVSNYSVAQMQAFAKGTDIDVAQLPYNLFEREIEADALPFCQKNNITVLSYGAICRGLLTGKFTKTSRFVGDDLRKNDPKFQQPRFDMYLHAVDALRRLGVSRFNKGPLALALRWVLDQNTVALWGARKPEQLQPVREVLGWNIDEAGLQAIAEVLHSTLKDEVGPEFMAPPSAA